MGNDVKSTDAVSPVVGVMLMLVVTIIIAAVVSAFAGGMPGSGKNTPHLTITGTYSQANGMTITHGGGDMVTLSSVNFMTTPSEVMGSDAGKFAWVINKTIIQNPANGNFAIWDAKNGLYNTTAFGTGDTFVVTRSDCTDYNSTATSDTVVGWPNPGVNKNAQVWWDSSKVGKSAYFAAYAFGNPANAGKYFYLDVVDSTGSVISRAKVTITK